MKGRFAISAATAGLLISLGWASAASVAQSIGLCNCCAGTFTQSCSKACAALKNTPGQCSVIVDYEAKAVQSQGTNPLNGISLKEMSLGEPSPAQLERFRRFLEKGRRKALASYKTALHQVKRRKISAADFDEARALYKEAMVNYYHGIRSYLDRVGRKSD